ncbi:MAG: hypothetical protein IIT65_13915 [Lachnospiraceae bacterium]|nr:hypothetical protein [Lachnospiraceae bacterium]
MSNAEQAVVESQVIDEVSKKKFNIDIKNILILLIDYIAINVAYVVSLMSVTNVSIELLDIEYLTFIIRVTPFYAVFTIAVYYIFRLYIDDYKKISVREMRRLLISNFLTTMVYVLIMFIIHGGFPSTFFLIGGMLQYFFTSGIRFLYRLVHVSEDKKYE